MANPSAPALINQNVSVSDPATPANSIKPNADGSINTKSVAGSNAVDIFGNAGAILDATLAPATAPANGIAVLGQFNSTLPAPTNGQTTVLQLASDGSLRSVQTLSSFADADGLVNAVGIPLSIGGTAATIPIVALHASNGTSSDRVRTAGIGNNQPATGILASAAYGQYNSNANQVVLTTGNYGGLQFTPDGAVRTAPQRPATTDILSGYQTFTATAAATTVITVPAGRTWVGTISANCACQEVAAGTAAAQARCVFSTSGATVTPAAGSYFAVEAKAGANAASGLVGTQAANFGSTPFTVTAPVGNTALIQVTVTIAGTAGVVDASAIGNLQ